MVVKDKLTREAQVQLIDAGQTLDAGRLEYDVFTDRYALPVGHAERRSRLDGETGVVLEINASSKFPRQVVRGIKLEHIGRIQVQVVVFSVDVEIRVIEVVAGGLIRKAATECALLALDRKPTQN